MTRSLQSVKQDDLSPLLNTREAAQLLARSPATLKRWRHARIGPEFIAIEGRISYRLSTLLQFLEQHTQKCSEGISNETT